MRAARSPFPIPLLACAVLALPLLAVPATHAAASTPPAAAAKPPAADTASGDKPADDNKKGAAGAPDGGFFGQLGSGSSNEPIFVHSDELEFDYQANKVIYRGSVNVVQGELKIDCKELLVNLARAGDQNDLALQEVVAVGDVVITQGTRTATGGRAIFDQQKRQITLLENPVLHDGPNEVTGERLVVYMDEGRSIVESSPKKRVSAILYPGKQGEGVDLTAPPTKGGKDQAKGKLAKKDPAATPQPASTAAVSPVAGKSR
jgi:lipopolysaccharide export system protein LptA